MAGGGRQRWRTATFLLSESWRYVHVAGSPGASGLHRSRALASACGRRRAEKNETARGTQRPAGLALSWGGDWKGATPDCNRIAGAKWSREVTVTLSAPLRIAEGTCTAARSAALANFAW